LRKQEAEVDAEIEDEVDDRSTRLRGESGTPDQR
jgi:hypothetical protein